ncbi:hypothetical protein PIB30_082833 [Stylosanthes scabra]|uniref:Benzyl alcohol O-benzoyltransferase n=1 Tax=Stylosanthes scabra TaxID=79078 RepID=A0ABU6VTC3_9FABA|nr:hypothetical protein [Stylosanthes scabra]
MPFPFCSLSSYFLSQMHNMVLVSSSSSPSVVFRVKRYQPELVAPATPTPQEVKLLSDIDDQEVLRFHIHNIYIYRHNPSMEGKDPVKVIRDALSRTLVFYYPFAGRLREGHGRKLMVDCTAEGVLFIEADADVTLDQFGEALETPFPFSKELLYNVPGSDGIVGCPLLLIQVTRFKCGGFTLGIRVNHTMCDGTGFTQFTIALGEMARGAHQPSVLPIWQRDLLSARNPPRITCNHREFEQVEDIKEWETIISCNGNMITRSFFFGPTEIASLRCLVLNNNHQLGEEYTRFELITACLWYCLAKALQLSPEKQVRLCCAVNGRERFNPPMPIGYYGNVISSPAAVITVKNLCEDPFECVVKLIKKAKAEATEEYMRSLADLMVIKGRPINTRAWSFLVSKLTRIGFRKVDFGWGDPVYGGPIVGNIFGELYLNDYENANGEEGVLVPIYLPANAMGRFAKEFDDFLRKPNQPTIIGRSKI